MCVGLCFETFVIDMRISDRLAVLSHEDTLYSDKVYRSRLYHPPGGGAQHAMTQIKLSEGAGWQCQAQSGTRKAL